MRMAYSVPNSVKSPTPGNAAQRILEMRRDVVADVGCRHAAVGRDQPDDEHEVRDRLGDADALLCHHRAGVCRASAKFVLHLDLGDVGIGALHEGQVDLHLAVRLRVLDEMYSRPSRPDICCRMGLDDRVGDRLRRGARVGDGDRRFAAERCLDIARSAAGRSRCRRRASGRDRAPRRRSADR